MSIGLGTDQTQHSVVGPDLGPNSLQAYDKQMIKVTSSK